MKKLLLMSMLISLTLAGFTQNNAPVAVDDTVPGSVLWGDTITINVVNNDYDPDGDYFYVFNGGISHTDSTITLTLSENYHLSMKQGWYFNSYTLKDELGGLDTSSIGKVHFYFENESYNTLDINNISALFNAYGNHFWDQEQSHYYFPKDSTTQTLFTNTLWLGGMDESNNLRLAAETYRQGGMDYQTGPLSYNNDSAWITSETVQDYLKIWKLDKTEVEHHVLNWNEPDYEPIENIANWPAHGDEALSQSYHLAPFVDMNNNGDYEPMQGDYPLIRGDQTLFFIMNDQRLHYESGGGTIGVEVHGFAYAFNSSENEHLNNTTFLSYKIFNRSQQTISNAYAGVWTDIDLGAAGNDFIGCDVNRGAYYGYNGTAIDEGGPESYGDHPPAQGVVILGGPYMDEDGIDNPDNECDESINGVGFGDGIADNERYGMSQFVYYDNNGDVTGNPDGPDDHYNYLKGIWRDNTIMQYGGNGHPNGGSYGPDANFMFPGLTDPCNWGTGGVTPNGPVDWTEVTEENEPGDRRGLCSMGPFTLKPGGFHKIDIAFVSALGDDYMHSVDVLMEAIDTLKSYYYQDSDHFGYAWMGIDDNQFSVKGLVVYPNPANDQIQIQYKPESNKASFILYNNFGQITIEGALKQQSSIQTISLKNIPQGLYILKVIDKNSVSSEKILIK